MSRVFKVLTKLVFLFIIVNILVFPPKSFHTYRLWEETMEDIRIYSALSDRWKSQNDKINKQNEWLELCRNGEIGCSEYDQQREPLPNIPRSKLYNDFFQARPRFIFTVVLWVIVIYLIMEIYNTIYPRIYTVNTRNDITYQGRMRYSLYCGKKAFLIGSPNLILAWIRMFRYNNDKQINIITNKGIVQLNDEKHKHIQSHYHRFKNRFYVFSKQFEYDNDGFIRPGESTWDSYSYDILQLKDIIDVTLEDTEEMTRRGTRGNHANRRKSYLGMGRPSGIDKAQELMIDNENYMRDSRLRQ